MGGSGGSAQAGPRVGHIENRSGNHSIPGGLRVIDSLYVTYWERQSFVDHVSRHRNRKGARGTRGLGNISNLWCENNVVRGQRNGVNILVLDNAVWRCDCR